MESLQLTLGKEILKIYPNAIIKKVEIDNFVDIHLPDIHEKKGTHLFFNTSGGKVKLGFYCRDNDFVEKAINSTDKIEKYSQGLRLLGNPQFLSVHDAVLNAKSFIDILSNKTINDNILKSDFEAPNKGLDYTLLQTLFEEYRDDTVELISESDISQGETAEKITDKKSHTDEVEDFYRAITNFKNKNIEEVAKYVEEGNPVLQFSDDNKPIDNYLISMVCGGNLNQFRLEQYRLKGLDIDATTSDNDRYTACHYASWDGNYDVLNMLIDAGANPDVIGGDSMTPLNLAASNGHIDCVKLLISNEVNLDNRVFQNNIYHSINGGSALRDAILNLQWKVADALISAGANVEMLNEKCLNGEDLFEVITQFAKNTTDTEFHILRVEEIKKMVYESLAISENQMIENDIDLSSDQGENDSISLNDSLNELEVHLESFFSNDDEEEDEDDYSKGYAGITVRIRENDEGEPNKELQARIREYLMNWQCPTKAYNGVIGFEGRIPSWITKIDTPDCCPKFSNRDIEFINSTILKDKIIPVLSYAPEEFYFETKQVWWIVPLSLWAGDKASWLFIDKNGIYAAHPGDDDIAMIYAWDRLEDMEYSTEDFDTYETEVHSLNLTSDNGGELTFVEFVPPGRGSYLSVVKNLYEIRKSTIEASRGKTQWMEGKGGEGFKSFDAPEDLLDSGKWNNPNRPNPSAFYSFDIEDDEDDESLEKIYFESGKQKYYDNDYHGATEDFNKAIELDSNYHEPYYFRGIINMILKKFNEAFEDFNSVLKIDSDNKWGYFHRGNALNELNDFTDAITDFDKALELDPNLKEAYKNRGDVKLKLNNFKEAIDDYTKGIELDSTYFLAYQSRGIAKGKLNDFSGAIDDYNVAVSIDGNNPWTYQNRGEAKSELNDFKGAIEDFSQVITIDSNYKWAYHNRGKAKSKLKNFEGAIEDFSQVIAIDSNYKWAYQNRGEAKSYLNDFESAIEDFSQVIAIDSNYKWAYQNRGKAKSRLNDFEGALVDFDKVIKIDPNYEWAYEEKGEIFFNQKEYKKAFECYTIILERSPDFCYDRRIAYNLGFIYHVEGNYLEAQRLYDIFSNLNISKKDLSFFYNQIQVEQRIEPLHLEEDELLQKGNKNTLVSALIRRGTIEHYNSSGEYDEIFSLKDLNNAIDIDPNSYLAYFLRAKIYLNDYYASYSLDKGIKDLESCLRIYKYLPALIKYSSLVNDYDLKIQIIKEAIEIDPENSLAWQRYGDYLFEGNEIDSALNAFAKSNEIEPDGDILQRIAKCYKVLNKHAKAIEFYTKAIYECEWEHRWMHELAQIYFDQNKLDLAESTIYRAIESYAIEEYYQFLFKILEKVYESPTHNGLLSDISEYLNATNLYEYPLYDEKQSDIDFLKSYESTIAFDQDSIFSTLKFMKDATLSYFLINGRYITKLHILRNHNLKLTKEQIDTISVTASFSILEACYSHPTVENSTLKTMVDSDDGSYSYSYKLLGALSNPNISQDIISSLSSNKFNWVLRKTYSLISDYKNADLNNKYVILGLLDNPIVSFSDKEKFEKSLGKLNANMYSLTFNTKNVSLEEYVCAEVQKDKIIDDLANSIASDEYSSWAEYCADKWHEFGDSEYGMIDDHISVSVSYKALSDSKKITEDFFDLNLSNTSNVENPKGYSDSNNNLDPGTFIHEVSSSEVGEYAFDELQLEWDFRPENIIAERTELRALITGFEYICNKESELNYVGGNLVNSRSKGTTICLYIKTINDLEEIPSYEEIKEDIISNGLPFSPSNIKLYFDDFILRGNNNKVIKVTLEGAGAEFNQGFISTDNYKKWLTKKDISSNWDQFCKEELGFEGYFDVSGISSFTGFNKNLINIKIQIDRKSIFTGSYEEFIEKYFEENREITSSINKSEDYGVYKFPSEGIWKNFFNAEEFEKRPEKLVTTITSEFFSVDSELTIDKDFDINKFGFLTVSTDEMGYGKDFGDYIVGFVYNNAIVDAEFSGGVGEISKIDIS